MATMAKAETSDPIASAVKELEDDNDRAVAIVGAALVEAALEDAIVSRLLPMSKRHREALFTDDASYTFARKIDLGMSLGLYGNNARLGLHRIKKIRHEFAHNLDRDFQHERIIKECNALSDYTDKEPLDHIKLEGTPPDMLAYIEGRERRFCSAGDYQWPVHGAA